MGSTASACGRTGSIKPDDDAVRAKFPARRENSLLAREKFPVPSRREFAANRLNFLGDSQPESSREADFFEIPC
jgi:hypothetical protein